jgi:hypothetical protein
MSVRVLLIQVFLCMNHMGLPFVMSYDQMTGRLEPVFATFFPTCNTEHMGYCQPKAMNNSIW